MPDQLILRERTIHETYVAAAATDAAGLSDTRKYVHLFFGKTLVVIPGPLHGLGTADLLLQCYDDQAPRHPLGVAWAVDAVTYEVQVSFEQPQTGRIILLA